MRPMCALSAFRDRSERLKQTRPAVRFMEAKPRERWFVVYFLSIDPESFPLQPLPRDLHAELPHGIPRKVRPNVTPRYEWSGPYIAYISADNTPSAPKHRRLFTSIGARRSFCGCVSHGDKSERMEYLSAVRCRNRSEDPTTSISSEKLERPRRQHANCEKCMFFAAKWRFSHRNVRRRAQKQSISIPEETGFELWEKFKTSCAECGNRARFEQPICRRLRRRQSSSRALRVKMFEHDFQMRIPPSRDEIEAI